MLLSLRIKSAGIVQITITAKQRIKKEERGNTMSKSYSWQDMANLTHKTQVDEFNFCLCEEQEEFPYEDCPKEEDNV